MWVEFVVGSLPCSERFFSGYSSFPLSNTSKFQFDLERTDTFERVLKRFVGKIGIYNCYNFSLDLDLLFDCSFVLQYAKIRAVLQFGRAYKLMGTYNLNRKALEGAYIWGGAYDRGRVVQSWVNPGILRDLNSDLKA